jgi:hypothetical protein
MIQTFNQIEEAGSVDPEHLASLRKGFASPRERVAPTDAREFDLRGEGRLSDGASAATARVGGVCAAQPKYAALAVPGNPRYEDQRGGRALYKRAWDDAPELWERLMSDKLSQHVLISIFTAGFLAGVAGMLWINEDRTAFGALTVTMAGALILTALLPKLSEFEFGPKRIRAKLQQIERQVGDNKEKLEQQQKVINDLVIYSLSQMPYNVLWKATKTPEYIYHNTDDMRRWCYVLLDNGFIELKGKEAWLVFDEKMEGRNLAEIVTLTPAGEFMSSLRGPPK